MIGILSYDDVGVGVGSGILTTPVNIFKIQGKFYLIKNIKNSANFYFINTAKMKTKM